MASEYRYDVYNPGQYPDDVQARWDALVADGWQVHTALPNYSEISILWHREVPAAPEGHPEEEPDVPEGGDRDSPPGA
jgi:hypothetical protein